MAPARAEAANQDPAVLFASGRLASAHTSTAGILSLLAKVGNKFKYQEVLFPKGPGGTVVAQLARRSSPASHSNVATTARARWCGLPPAGRPPPPTATSPRRIACATVSPSASCCPVATDCSPRIGRTRSLTGTWERSIGCVVGWPGARCSPVTMCTASGASSRTARVGAKNLRGGRCPAALSW